MAKRGNGDGSYRQRANGTFECRITLPDGTSRCTYGKTRKEAGDKARAARRAFDEGINLGSAKQTVAAFLDSWIVMAVETYKAPKTTAGYRDIVRLHLKPALGHHQLS